MKIFRKWVAAVGALAAMCAGADAGDWPIITVNEGSFSVSMPGEPEHDIMRNETPQLGQIEVHTLRYRAVPTTFLVGYVAYLSTVPMDPRTEMESNRDHFLQGVGGQVTEQHDISLEGATGIEFTAESAAYRIRSRVYFRDNRSYQLIAAVRKGEQDSASVERFLGSLKLKGKD
jgi:hypothetical protein